MRAFFKSLNAEVSEAMNIYYTLLHYYIIIIQEGARHFWCGGGTADSNITIWYQEGTIFQHVPQVGDPWLIAWQAMVYDLFQSNVSGGE